MSLEAPRVWRIFAGKLKTITNMQKKSLPSDIYQHIMAWKCTMAIQSIVHRFSFYLCMKYNITNT